ncbi:MAG: tRNA uridine-5-carboxymethylaminomethyl(34) synthesis GTPase MnmE [Prevotella sp.]|nr:tRNA uridine-5-carboxymethylaminomethyl(34) synthesis GTPase MnmE [Prevotella sp.]
MNETICALATAPGGAIGIIRVSGPKAFDAVTSICSVNCANCAANTTHFTRLVSPYASTQSKPEVIDEAMVTVFKAPRSYTGEDCVEISCHGSQYILNKVLELLVQNGCRMARPGEYTMRAYLNGKLDLSQAEAVADLIASTNRATHQLAMSQLRGGITNELDRLREQLLNLTSLLELELDFSDHEDLEFANREELLQLAQSIDAHITRLSRSFEIGQAIKQGIPVAIIGKTNVGKSTLLNALLKDDRAIVSDIHGTTRDTIEDTINIQGIQFRFIDTAGIRQTNDEVEQIGINRTYAAISKARIVLWLLDAMPTQAEIADITQRSLGRTLIPVWNKTDINAAPTQASLPGLSACPESRSESHSESRSASNPVCSPVGRDNIATLPLIPISAKHNQGLDALEDAIYAAANLPTLSESDVIVTNARHYDALIRAHSHLQRVLYGLNTNLSGDLLAEDLRLTLDTLAEITGGQITPQETLNNIFKHFCVGK